MKISGFAIVKNAVINNYPIVEAVESVLPVVDEMIVLLGDSEDNTNELIKNINSPKIKMHHSVWDKSRRKGGEVLAIETDKAFDLISPDSDWAFYIQADEVVHEKYHAAILEGCKKYENDKKVQGLLFKYLHFYGTYDYVADSRQWYDYEVRIIRNDKNIRAYRDAQGFRSGTKKLHVKPIDAFVYHYGYVKSPDQMEKKIKEISRYWNEETEDWKKFINSEAIFDYQNFDSLKKFTGTHPAVMKNRIQKQDWALNFDITQKKFSFSKRLLYWYETKTGKRLFTFKNYKII